MRILLASAAAAAFAFAATPAAAQYGGSAQDQVEGAPAETEAAEDLGAPAPDDQAFTPVVIPDQDLEADVDSDADSDVGAVAGKDEDVGGEQYALADVDADLDVDADVDVDLDQDDAERSGPGDAYEGVDAAEDDAAPEPEGATWQSEDGRATCRRSDGTTGLVVGGGTGALIGRGIDGGRNRAGGTIIGGIIGAVVGSAIERSASEQSCR